MGLTGGIGSGKSTIAAMFASVGASVIDADKLSRQLTAPGGQAMPLIAERFGRTLLTAQDALDRDAMRALILRDPQAKTQLEAIIHPMVGLRIKQQEDAAILAGARLIVLDIPLLVESTHWRMQLDCVLVVDCDNETQIQRVQQRSKWPVAQIEAIIAAQASRALRLQAADWVIYNQNISLVELEQQVRHCARHFGHQDSDLDEQGSRILPIERL